VAKRNLFDEIKLGFHDLKSEREGKITLRTTELEPRPEPEITPEEIVAIREGLGYSQGVFASVMRMKVATLRNWEQGRTKPNREATLLLRLVEKDPAVIMELEAI